MNNEITKGKLNRMFKYFRNKNVKICYEYNNSLGHHCKRNYKITYNRLTIEEVDLRYYKEYQVKLFFDDKCLFEQHFCDDWCFTGLGQMKYCNSGPYCYFTIHK